MAEASEFRERPYFEGRSGGTPDHKRGSADTRRGQAQEPGPGGAEGVPEPEPGAEEREWVPELESGGTAAARDETERGSFRKRP